MAESEINTEGVNGIKFQMKDVVSQRSELMQEIVSDRPGFLIRWGNVFFLMVLVLIAVACWLAAVSAAWTQISHLSIQTCVICSNLAFLIQVPASRVT